MTRYPMAANHRVGTGHKVAQREIQRLCLAQSAQVVGAAGKDIRRLPSVPAGAGTSAGDGAGCGGASLAEGNALMDKDLTASEPSEVVAQEATPKKATRSRRASAKVSSPAPVDEAAIATNTASEQESAAAPVKKTTRKAPAKKAAPVKEQLEVPVNESLSESDSAENGAAPAAKKAPARRKPRVATAAVGSPAVELSAETTLVDQLLAAADSSQGSEDTEKTEPVAKKAPARKSRAKVAKNAPADKEPAVSASITEPVAQQIDTEPVRKTRRKRAVAPESAPVAEETSEKLELPVEASEPAKRPSRRRKSVPAADVTPTSADAAVESAVEQELAAEKTEDALAAVVEAVETAAVEEAAASDQATQTPVAPATPSFASPFMEPGAGISALFLAPDLSQAIPATAADTEDEEDSNSRRGSRRSRNRRARQVEAPADNLDSEDAADSDGASDDDGVTSRRRRRRRRGDQDLELTGGNDEDPPNTVTKVRAPRVSAESTSINRVTSLRGSTRLEAKKQRRRDSRDSGRRRTVITEAEFLARRESVDRVMVVRQNGERIQIGVLEDGILAEHFVSKTQQDSLIGNVYLGKVQNVLPSMEAAFVDIGRGRNAVLYAGEVDWDAAELNGQPRRIENALKSGDSVLVQVSKDPVGQKGARLTSQISLPGRYLVYVPGGSMTGISRKLPDVERNRLKRVLKDHLPEDAGVIVRTAAEGASEEELTNDINRLRAQWEGISSRATSHKTLAPEMLYGEPDLTIKVVRDVFNEDFSKLVVSGDQAWDTIEAYVTYVAPDLLDRLEKWTKPGDIFIEHRIEEQIYKALDRKVYLPSGGSLVIDRTEAMTVVDVNTGKFTGSGGNLEETVTKNNLEAAEEVVRQLRLRDIGGIIVIDFIDMVLESNRDLVLRRLVECLGRDRTKHQVAEVTSLGLVQMTRKRMGTGLLEVFGEQCEACAGRGMVTHEIPVEHRRMSGSSNETHHHSNNNQKAEPREGERTVGRQTRSERKRNRNARAQQEAAVPPVETEAPAAEIDPELEAQRQQKASAARAALANIAAAAAAAHHDPAESGSETTGAGNSLPGQQGGQQANEQAENRSENSDGTVEVELQTLPNSFGDLATLTLGGEAVVLPRGQHHNDAPVQNKAERLAGLSEALDQLAESHGVGEKAAESTEAESQSSNAQAPQEVTQEQSAGDAGTSHGRSSRSRRARRNRSARSAQGASGGETSEHLPVADTAATGSRVTSESHKPAESQAKSAEPIIMLGVGVPASEL